MFVRTQRLTLRPGWIEDAPELARAINHWEVCSKLETAPWPYSQLDAEDFLGRMSVSSDAFFLICAHEGGVTRLVGGMGVHAKGNDEHELGYWLMPDAWGRGYATEAGMGVVRLARESLRLKRLVAGHFIDNPASGKVLRKLGFRPTGRIVQRESRARSGQTPCAMFELDLCSEAADNDPRTRMAA
ncbi:GNAT family N-acetyltransferase [Sphingomonas sp. AOB5]|uniref:GNAT family N-acetyltransferase n=1 Tax=Sphingomonas sp. AOB5 TaxID=3034017 RepID=UPI0023F6CE37|nr:GNAT family N-acetyltransferase [Sphingomonas sp. AOB5]MDF7775721.1 GNAT family N-acetyltransferase [Sphingomonas sp. AOB5]